MTEFLPPAWALVLFNAFAIARFENRHWWEERARSRRAEGRQWQVSEFGFPDWTFLAGTAFFYLFLLWLGWSMTWVQALVLFASSWIVGWTYVLISSWLLGSGTSVLWRPATLAMWPLALVMAWLMWRWAGAQ